MAWNTLLPNQCISYNNLQDACNQSLFFFTQPIPISQEQITKQDFQDYILVPDSVSQYPAYVFKSQNQLVVKSDLEVHGGVTLVPNYGIYFTAVDYYNFSNQIPIGGFTYPVVSTTTSQYYSNFGVSGYNYLYISVDGTSTSSLGYISVQVAVNGNIISSNNFYYTSGAQSTVVSFPNIIYAPDSIEITIIDGQAVPINFSFSDQNGGIPITAVTMNRGSGQYAMVATGSNGGASSYLKGELYRSIDYGATFQKAAGNTLYYWDKIAISDTGQYMLASSLNGPLFLSTNYGASYTDITSYVAGGSSEYFEGIGISGNGQYILVCTENKNTSAEDFLVYFSNNYGAPGSWINITLNFYGSQYGNDWSVRAFAISNDGQYIYASGTDLIAIVRKSSNYGANWSTVNPGTVYARDISCSSDGSTVVVTGAVPNYGASYLTRGFCFKSTNYGASFSSIEIGNSYLRNWIAVGQLYVTTSPSGYGTVMTYAAPGTGQVTSPAETYPVGGDSLGSIINGSVSGMGQRVFTDSAVGGIDGPYRLIGSTTGLFRSTNAGSTWTQL